MATHSSILAWRIPRTEEPEGYSPWAGRVGHECTTNTQPSLYISLTVVLLFSHLQWKYQKDTVDWFVLISYGLLFPSNIYI